MFDIQGNKIKFHESSSEWIRSFDLTGIKCLIVCRGPVRKEAMDVFCSRKKIALSIRWHLPLSLEISVLSIISTGLPIIWDLGKKKKIKL